MFQIVLFSNLEHILLHLSNVELMREISNGFYFVRLLVVQILYESKTCSTIPLIWYAPVFCIGMC